MGFIDLSGALGRDFGSIGVGLDEIRTRLRMRAAPALKVAGVEAERTRQCVQRLCRLLNVPDALAVEVEAAIPGHVGLGSGTQLALAVGMALARLYGLQLSVRDIARVSERGARSGIGIGVFELGGLVVDGGRGPGTVTPPVLARLPVPADWRFILVFDRRGQGLHGEQELDAFRQLPAFPRGEAERLSYLLLMQALPAIAEADLDKFGAVISELQLAVGRHFAPVQGGVYTSADVAAAVAFLQGLGAAACGQTSWGPTGFCAVAGQATAAALVCQARERFAAAQLDFQVVSARNSGAEVHSS